MSRRAAIPRSPPKTRTLARGSCRIRLSPGSIYGGTHHHRDGRGDVDRWPRESTTLEAGAFHMRRDPRAPAAEAFVDVPAVHGALRPKAPGPRSFRIALRTASLSPRPSRRPTRSSSRRSLGVIFVVIASLRRSAWSCFATLPSLVPRYTQNRHRMILVTVPRREVGDKRSDGGRFSLA